MIRVLVTGGTGFVGRVLVRALRATGRFDVVVGSRDGRDGTVAMGDIDGNTDWRSALSGCDAVVHLAARAHVLQDAAQDPLTEFRRTNTDGTLNLARQASEAGVKRFVFVSSIGVNGALGNARGPFTERDAPQPTEDYAVSKWEAEQGLKRLEGQTSMGVVVVRPPLVYGPGCPGNFLRLLKLVATGLPLPLGSVSALRSYVGVDNLCDFLRVCIEDERAAGKTFVIADDKPLALPEVLRELASGMGRSARLLPVPQALLQGAATLAGKGALYRKLCGTLVVDASRARNELGWQAPVTSGAGLRRTGEWYAGQHSTKQ
ncbi:NAD-dependent epimerase/dehydratase family protein [Pandoraea sputorum]|uniref:NAD-dependent epimerase/dehydratase family protein n=1 Tax=Pandoraea sputorum TaxID=93222 RepID=UPI002AF6A560|nr:NAD-dependent epimerase/dehydratase family protein [Pandoraea sputorum]